MFVFLIITGFFCHRVTVTTVTLENGFAVFDFSKRVSPSCTASKKTENNSPSLVSYSPPGHIEKSV